MPFERSIRVAGTFNFRDIGHYEARDGRHTRPAVLFRSGAIHDLAALRELGVRSVIDLRSASDVERDAGPLGALREHSAVARLAQPLLPQQIGRQPPYEWLNERYGQGVSAERYLGYLEIGSDNVRQVFDSFARPGAFPAVVHCTAGKDRTGVIVALLLDLLGVSRDTIVADYALSNAAVPDLIRHLAGDSVDVDDLSESDLFRYGAPPEVMEGFLDALYREHGSARTFLEGAGVASASFSILEEALLTAAGDDAP